MKLKNSLLFITLILSMAMTNCGQENKSPKTASCGTSDTSLTNPACKTDNSDDTITNINILDVTPKEGSTNVSGSPLLIIRFSTQLGHLSFNPPPITLYDKNKTSIPGTIYLSSDRQKLIFIPKETLQANTTYRAVLSSDSNGLRSESGNVLKGAKEWTFTTSDSIDLIDQDQDGLIDKDEIQLYGSDPNDSDSDDDGLNDYGEILAGLSPTVTNESDANTDPLFSYQWHLANTGQDHACSTPVTAGEDINILPAWKLYSGTPEVLVSIVDSGIDANNPDLKFNIDIEQSYRYFDSVKDPNPHTNQINQSNYPHGTAVAGLVASRGWNGRGLRGVAPFTKLASLNVFSSGTDAAFTDALGRKEIDISSNSWGSSDSTQLFDDYTSLEGVEQGIELGRDGKGVIYIFAAGNDNFSSNTSTLHNSKFVTTVAAVAGNGKKASYSNFGANVRVSAPGGEDGINSPAIATTNITGSGGYPTNRNLPFQDEYTSYMNGTSAATPIVSGIAALVLQVNNQLTWRDVKYILSRSTRKNDPTHPDWSRNAAGYDFNPKYGFGLIDAYQAVTLAGNHQLLPTEQVSTKYKVTPKQEIPDGEPAGLTSTITVLESFSIEHVDIWVNLPSHPSIRDLKIVIISPSGTESILAYPSNEYSSRERYESWRFSSAKFLDENSQGVWTLKIVDSNRNKPAGVQQIFEDWSLQVSGY